MSEFCESDQNITIDLTNKRIEERSLPDSDRPVSRQIEVAFYGVTTKAEQSIFSEFIRAEILRQQFC